VTLNIKDAKSKSTPTRQVVTDELLRELSDWKPRDRIGAFRRWLSGSLSIVHLHVLTVLEADGPLAMGRLAEALDVSVASATGIVDRMEQRGLVERRDDENDRRVVHVHSTDAGRHVFSDLDEHRRRGLTRLLARLTDDELTAFLTGLRAMRAAREALAAEDAAVGSEPGPAAGPRTGQTT
jgi:DNA-binding MarR family transcriptional regulator